MTALAACSTADDTLVLDLRRFLEEASLPASALETTSHEDVADGALLGDLLDEGWLTTASVNAQDLVLAVSEPW